MSYELSVRLRVGRCEVELRGSRDEVMDIIENHLDKIVSKISSALETKTQSRGEVLENEISEYPVIRGKGSCSQAVTDLLSTEWGNEPRTSWELLEAMRVNGISYPKTTLSGVLKWLVEKGRLRRWKKGRSYVYTLRQARD